SLQIRSVAIEPLGEPRNHVADHFHALLRREVGCSRHIFLARPRTARKARDLLTDETGPGRIARSTRKHGPPDLDRCRGPALLLGCDAKEVSRFDVCGIELDCALER